MKPRVSPCAGAKGAQKRIALSVKNKLAKRVALGRLRSTSKIYEAIGRLKERYPRVARYYELAYDEQQRQLSSREDLERKQRAQPITTVLHPRRKPEVRSSNTSRYTTITNVFTVR